MFLHLFVSHSVHRFGMCGKGCVCLVKGECMAKGGMHGEGACIVKGEGVCVAKGGMHGKGGHAWQGAALQGGGHAWQGGEHGKGRAYMAGVCMEEGMHGRGYVWQATAADGMHPNGMHSYFSVVQTVRNTTPAQ